MSSTNLETSRQQLSQVEAALAVSPNDEELQLLAENLRSFDFIVHNKSAIQHNAMFCFHLAAHSKRIHDASLFVTDTFNCHLFLFSIFLEEVIALQMQLTTTTETTEEGKIKTQDGWSIGDDCEAVWSEDGNYYSAVIIAFEDHTQVRVRYTEYEEEDVVKIQSLRRPKLSGTNGSGVTANASAEETRVVSESNKPRPSRDMEREQKRKKAKRKKEKDQQEQQVLEQQKNKWKNFAQQKSRKKGTGSGRQGASIFATPDDPSGKVGIGTCGIGGRGMTDYQNRGKWKFNATNDDE
eukprot:gene254-3630_t